MIGGLFKDLQRADDAHIVLDMRKRAVLADQPWAVAALCLAAEAVLNGRALTDDEVGAKFRAALDKLKRERGRP